MAFAGVSVIADGKLLSGSTTPTVNAAAASGYHLLVVEGHSRISEKYIRSRFFTVGGHRWSILYCPNGYSKETARFTSFHLCNQGGTTVKAQFEVSFVDETEKQDPARVRAGKMFEVKSSVGNDRFIKRDALLKSKHFKDDSFTICCDVVVPEEDLALPCVEVPPSEMKQNFTDLLLAREGTDVVFRVSGETFAAHRCVLAARSAVFKALLFGPMKEGMSTAGVVQIDDMDAKVFKALLTFIYGDTFSDMAEEGEDGVIVLQDLLVAADRYDLRRLRAICEKRLCDHISVSTAMTILALAEQHSCHGLKKTCYEFLRCPANLKAVVATDGFDHLCRSCPPVMKDLVIGMLQAPK